MNTPRREFLKQTMLALAAGPAWAMAPDRPAHRHIDQSRCIGCGSCLTICPLGAISLARKSRIDPDQCAECGVCQRSRVCPADAIAPGRLAWPRVIREVFSNPLAEHESTGVPGRGTEGVKTNDSSGRYGRDQIGAFVELGRPVLGARFADAQTVVRAFTARGFPLVHDNSLNELLADPRTGALRPEVLAEKALSILAEFTVPRDQAAAVLDIAHELTDQVANVFNLSVALRADSHGRSPLAELFPGAFSLPNGKVNLGFAAFVAAGRTK